jgi:twinkle protein
MRFKDANECLQAGVLAAAMLACLEPGAVEVIRPDRLKSIYDFEEDIWQKFHPSGRDQLGLVLPWGNFHGSSLPFRFRYGEVTVWTGYNKHGKSEVLNHCMVDLCWQGEKALICSLEVQAPETYRKVIRMVMGRRDVCTIEEREQFRDRCLRPLAERIWVYDQVGTAQLEDVFNVMLYAFQRYGCRQFVLDSFMRFDGMDGEGQDIWNRQKDFMDRLTKFAALYQVHIHLVAHSKKPQKQGEAAIPRRYDIMGSSYISNVPQNVIVVWRNRAKQDALEEIFQQCEDLWRSLHPTEKPLPFRRLMGGPPPNTRDDLKLIWRRMVDIVERLPEEVKTVFQERIEEHDAYFIVDAQRGGDGDCPARHLWFHVDSLQFLEASAWKVKDTRSQPRAYAGAKPVSDEPGEEEML